MPIHQGVSFDLKNRRYKLFRSWAGLRIGAWQKLPTIQRIVIKNYSYAHTSDSKYNWSARTERIKEYVLLLSIANSRSGVILRNYPDDGLEEAQLTAASLSAVLNVEVKIFDPHVDEDNALSI